LGIEHGVDLDKLIKVGKSISFELLRTNIANVKAEDLNLIKERKEELFK
jgi:hypothetical protein